MITIDSKQLKRNVRKYIVFLCVLIFLQGVIVFSLPLMHLAPPVFAAQTITVSTASQLTTALKNVKAGETILLKDGTYTGSVFTLTGKKGTNSSPIIIKAVNRNKAVISGSSNFVITDSAYITIDGLEFKNSGNESVLVVNSGNTTITRNIFHQNENGKNLNWIFIRGTKGGNNRIERNLFENKKDKGKFIGIDSSDPKQSAALQNNYIGYNHFRNIGPFEGNGKEAIRIGVDNLSTTEGRNKIEFNLFENCTGDGEVISVKSSGNIVRFNTFRNNIGSLTSRQGNSNQFYGNFFLGGKGGIRVTGADHLIFNNYFEGTTGDTSNAPLYIRNGDKEKIPHGVDNAYYARPRNITIAFNTFVNNTHNIVLGAADYGTLAPRDMKIVNNIVVGSQNKLISFLTEPENTTLSGNIMYATGTAVLGITASPRQIEIVNPLLIPVDSVQKLSDKSPAINRSIGNYTSFLNKDMDGQDRDGMPDIGADERSSQLVIRKPLNASDVGPNSN